MGSIQGADKKVMKYYLVERQMFGCGGNNKDKIVQKSYHLRRSKYRRDDLIKSRRCIERVAKIDFSKLKWGKEKVVGG